MQKTRHDLFQQMTLALSHQQNGNAILAMAYWENVLRLLPESIQIHNEILETCQRIVPEDLSPPLKEKWLSKVETLAGVYVQKLSDDEGELAHQIYLAMCQQCGGNPVLALVYWENVRSSVTSDSLIITLAVQDLCWLAHQYLTSKNTEKCIELYKHMLRTFPEFLEGYLNLSLILYKHGLLHEVLPVLHQIPKEYKEEVIVLRYTALFQRISEVSQQFDQVPYAAIESIVSDLRIENTFYPSINETYFTSIITDFIHREKRFFERRRKALEEKAIARANKRLASEGIALGQRVTMARQASSEDIHKFLYDNNLRIAEVLLDNPNITADEVLIIAQNCHISDVLTCISAHRKWGMLYSIRIAILSNPQTFPRDSLRLLKTLSVNDLAKTFYNKNIPTEVRIHAKARIQELFHSLMMPEKIALIEASSGEIFKLLDEARFNVASFLVNLIGKFPDQSDILVNICRWKLTPADVLIFIGGNRQLTANLRIKFALLSNPKTPAGIVRSLLHSIPDRDVRYLLSNPHIPSTVKHSISAMFSHVFF